jgi:hypothetical protein
MPSLRFSSVETGAEGNSRAKRSRTMPAMLYSARFVRGGSPGPPPRRAPPLFHDARSPQGKGWARKTLAATPTPIRVWRDDNSDQPEFSLVGRENDHASLRALQRRLLEDPQIRSFLAGTKPHPIPDHGNIVILIHKAALPEARRMGVNHRPGIIPLVKYFNFPANNAALLLRPFGQPFQITRFGYLGSMFAHALRG